MSTFILIHGSWHGGWCWYKVVNLLEQAGHRVIAPDLASLGSDKTPISEVTPNTWSESICKILDAETEPVILVGHSRGGMVISQVAEARPDKVKTLVYLTAFLLRDGESVLQAGQGDTQSQISPNIIIDEAKGSATIREEAIQQVFYSECDEEDVVLARLLLQPEALAPLGSPIHITAGNFGQVPRVYIECLRDKAIGPVMQKRMYSATYCERVITMDTDHSPFFSAPEELVDHLVSI